MTDANYKDIISLSDQLRGRSIVFVGMMGCGKTAIGRLVAKAVNLPFQDADEEIEKAAGMSVADFFKTYGEEEFRAGERKVIARLLAEGQSVLALGGGAFVSSETRNCVSQNAISIWLRADLKVIYTRVMRRPEKRPLLLTDDPKQKLAQLLEQRQSYYALANLTVDTLASTKNITRDSVLDALNTFLMNENTTDD